MAAETPSDSERFFDAIAGRYDRAYALPADDSRRRMTTVLGELPPAPARVLDLGVGTGRELSALLDAGYLPTGVDRSQAMLDRCARRARPIPLVRADFWPERVTDASAAAPQTLPFDEASFDAVVALHGTLAHPPDADAPFRLATELARLVRKGGRLIAEVPSERWIDAFAGSSHRDIERRVRRTGLRTCVYEDLVVGASVTAHVFDRAEWQAALSPFGRTRVEPLGELEWLVVAERS